MSRYDYQASKTLALADAPVYALVMAALRQADTGNSAALRSAFPGVWEELKARYYAPGGYLPGEWVAEETR